MAEKCCIYKRINGGEDKERIVPIIKYRDEACTEKSDTLRCSWICCLLSAIFLFVLSLLITPFIYIGVTLLVAACIVLRYFEIKECDSKWLQIVAISQNEENMKLREEYLEQRKKVSAEIKEIEETKYTELTPKTLDRLEKLKRDIRYEEYL